MAPRPVRAPLRAFPAARRGPSPAPEVGEAADGCLRRGTGGGRAGQAQCGAAAGEEEEGGRSLCLCVALVGGKGVGEAGVTHQGSAGIPSPPSGEGAGRRLLLPLPPPPFSPFLLLLSPKLNFLLPARLGRGRGARPDSAPRHTQQLELSKLPPLGLGPRRLRRRRPLLLRPRGLCAGGGRRARVQ